MTVIRMSATLTTIARAEMPPWRIFFFLLPNMRFAFVAPLASQETIPACKAAVSAVSVSDGARCPGKASLGGDRKPPIRIRAACAVG